MLAANTPGDIWMLRQLVCFGLALIAIFMIQVNLSLAINFRQGTGATTSLNLTARVDEYPEKAQRNW
jgi:hypothetical protein